MRLFSARTSEINRRPHLLRGFVVYLRKSEIIIWVDAIYIDEGSEKERGHQAQPGDTRQKTLHRFSKGIAEGEPQMDFLSTVQFSRIYEHWDLVTRQCAAFMSLLKDPWFKAVWILQEVAKAKAAVVCTVPKKSRRAYSPLLRSCNARSIAQRFPVE
ncbi:uncharacterized protein BDR25DRAFT_359931 [Lindgomyces ingoldianus]|uniref:Uncharacterized protein n=1 Tax=Lindgomyces ingoldianus TaxID=673940 RepID=A0ACB6QGP3_9PLEO|nr:uncharacterized protein BDR25DRAFT_359931 [Lindgomyces ingoldianus]KAF2466143.1 hypothetical protein BDR25DRAFT_359931 [Lindgomyces ingoldianus]